MITTVVTVIFGIVLPKHYFFMFVGFNSKEDIQKCRIQVIRNLQTRKQHSKLWLNHRELHYQPIDGRRCMHYSAVMKCRRTTPIPVSQSGFELGALISEIKYWSHQSAGILKRRSRKQIEIALTILTRKYEQATSKVDTVAGFMCTVQKPNVVACSREQTDKSNAHPILQQRWVVSWYIN